MIMRGRCEQPASIAWSAPVGEGGGGGPAIMKSLNPAGPPAGIGRERFGPPAICKNSAAAPTKGRVRQRFLALSSR